MAKRKWNDKRLKKRSEACLFVAMLFAILVAVFYFTNVSAWLLTLPLVGAIVAYAIGWYAERKDIKIGKAQKVDKKPTQVG